MTDARARSRSTLGSLSGADLAILVAAIVAISSSALLVRYADASAVALAFWRTLGGGLFLWAADRWLRSGSDPIDPTRSSSPTRAGQRRPTRAQWLRIGVAGLALAVHFAAWLASLELTSVAASVTLVATAPLMIALYDAVGGRRPTMMTWIAVVLAIAGSAVITLGDLAEGADQLAGGATTDATVPFGLSATVWGDILALVGAAAMAVYLVVGAELRGRLSTTAYASRAYTTAAVVLGAWAMVSRVSLVGFNPQTWLAIAAMTAGPQLVGHTGLNHLLRRLGSLTVSLALLVEPVAASLLVWAFLGEIPPSSAVVGAPIVIGAVALHLVGHRVANGSIRPDPRSAT